MNKKYCMYICIFSFILLNILLLGNCFKIKQNQENYFRLHIVANSDLIDDQITKLKVSKKITNYLNSICNSNLSDSYATQKEIESNIPEILEIANNELKENGMSYEAYAKVGKISYEEKHSEMLDMEKGTYNSVQIILGNGNGENFWTLIFPYADITNNEENQIDFDNNDIEIKSGILETLKKVAKSFS